MVLSIIIVSFNARADLERCLESLRAAPPAVAHEIIVVDNGSTDGSVEAARRFPGVRVIEAGANLGFARANNIGIRASTRREPSPLEQRHRRPRRLDSIVCSTSSTAIPRSPSSARGWWMVTAAPSCRSAG